MLENTVSGTILEQMGGCSRISMFTGAKKFFHEKDAVSFKFPSPPGGPNHVHIKLEPDDTYTVTFSNVLGKEDVKLVSQHTEVYCDMLKELFEQETGLYLSL